MNCVTYNNEKCRDGLGAQYQRIIGLYAVAKKYGLQYVHTPPLSVGHGETTRECEEFFNLRNFPASSCKQVVDLESFDIEKMQGCDTLYRVFLPYEILDKQPEIYEDAMGDLRAMYHATPKPALSYEAGHVNVAVHVRRGHTDDTRRLPNEAYVQAMKTVQDELKSCIFHVFSDEKASKRLPSYGDTRFCLGGSALQTFHHLVMSDVLITSRSSFSYLAGLYSVNQVYYTPFWHSPLSRWKILKKWEDQGEKPTSWWRRIRG